MFRFGRERKSWVSREEELAAIQASLREQFERESGGLFAEEEVEDEEEDKEDQEDDSEQAGAAGEGGNADCDWNNEEKEEVEDGTLSVKKSMSRKSMSAHSMVSNRDAMSPAEEYAMRSRLLRMLAELRSVEEAIRIHSIELDAVTTTTTESRTATEHSIPCAYEEMIRGYAR
jgi:hypothetical protein